MGYMDEVGDKMMEGLVSVVIPVYNRENTIKRAIDSVLCQTYANLEIIIVDDGSTDNTVEIVKGYEDRRIRLVCQKENGGANKARNIGIANSRGEYIAFQDSDDEWFQDKLRTQIEYMELQGCMACYCPYNLCERDSMRTIPGDFSNLDKYQRGLREILAEYNVVGTPTLLIKRDVLKLLGGEYFDEQLPRMQDYDFVVRLVQICRVGYINKPLMNAYRTGTSISRNFGAMYAAASMLLEKHKGFFKTRQFINALVKLENGIDDPQGLIEAINMLQKRAAISDTECKDVMLAYLAQKVYIQNLLLSGQYQQAVNRLQDRRFAIYGAGKIGHDVYRNLKRKGLCPACFLVTECDKNQDIDGIPVLSIDEYQNREDMVIISIAVEHQAELMNNLILRGYKQFTVYHKEVI